MFQSLFYWILFLRMYDIIIITNSKKFQSLFYWILFLRPPRRAARWPQFRFQSLFYWILFLRNTASLCSFPLPIRFQSLFYWILFLRHLCRRQLQPPEPVSILVLLDFVLKVVDQVVASGKRASFQSLFYWILFLRMDTPANTTGITIGFNPCFIGFCS